jgi:hypothetical protein
MKKLLIALATTVALAGPAHAAGAASLPKGLAGKWCLGQVDEKGETPYGPPLETGKCSDDGASGSAFIISPKSIRIQDPDLDDIVCRIEQFEARLVKGVMRISFTAKCPEQRVKASGWFWEHKAMNLKWEN